MSSAPSNEEEARAPSDAFTFASSHRGAARDATAARWYRVRGPLLTATVLAIAQAMLLFIVVRFLQDRNLSLRYLVPVAALSTLALLAWLGLVRASFGGGDEVNAERAVLESVGIARRPLRDGLTVSSARVLARETQSRLGYDAISVTSRGEVLAHEGPGGDHHGVGKPIPPGADDAMRARRVTRLPVGWKHGCDGRDCPLRSAIVVPLAIRGEAVGSILLFSEKALQVSDRDRAVGAMLGELVSNELALGELESRTRETADAELATMQAQIEPHFLFNALNTIAAFCRTKPDEARQLVLAFADHCRFSLRRPGAFVTLREELQHVEAYVALERARFGDQLDVEIRASSAALDAEVPPFLVQPLVENAIKHGKVDRPLRVVVHAEVRFGRLRVTVRDNGKGVARELADTIMDPGVGSGAAGLGLASAAQRVSAFYGDEGRVRVASAARIGTLVSIVLPITPPPR